MNGDDSSSKDTVASKSFAPELKNFNFNENLFIVWYFSFFTILFKDFVLQQYCRVY